MKEKISLISDMEKIDQILGKCRVGKKADPKPIKPKLKIIFIYSEKNNQVNGYLYAYDLTDGYFRICILDDLDTLGRLDVICAKKLIRKLIDYCKKHNIDIYSTLGKYGYGKSETDLYKKIGFAINKRKRVAEYLT